MTTPQAGPVRTSMQFAEEHNTIINVINTGGSFGLVHLSIPRPTANLILSDFNAHKIDRSTACTRLRASLHAIKVTKGHTDDAPDNLRSEIGVLRHIATSGHPNIVRILDADAANDDRRWYTMELLTGGPFRLYTNLLVDLREHQVDPPTSYAPDSFGWHLVFQVTEALLALHFGDKNGQHSTQWPCFYHADIHADNIVFRGGSNTMYGNYSDMVLIDLGQAKMLSRDADERRLEAFAEKQRMDMLRVTYTLGVKFRDSCKAIDDLYDEVRALDLQKGRDGNLVLKTWMRQLRLRAMHERDISYVPLHPDVVQHFEKEFLSDADLWEQFASSMRSA